MVRHAVRDIDSQVVRVQIDAEHATLVDARDEHLLYARRWYMLGRMRRTRYVAATVGKSHVYLHRLIARARAGQVVDHINRDSLDNRRANLRLCTQRENIQNSAGRGVSSYRGVCWHRARRKWTAAIGGLGRRRWLGYFAEEIEAALAYDAAADALLGPLGYRNFPNLIRADVARQMLEGLSSQIFGVTFRRRSEPVGRVRRMVCRRGVRKPSKGGALAFDPAEHALMSVYDMKNKSFRFINLEQLMLLSMGGKKWRVRTQSQKSCCTAASAVRTAATSGSRQKAGSSCPANAPVGSAAGAW